MDDVRLRAGDALYRQAEPSPRTTSSYGEIMLARHAGVPAMDARRALADRNHADEVVRGRGLIYQ
jgi:hypothetical protein